MKWFRKPSSAPLWQDEFPVFTADERYVNRRQFTKFLTLTSFATAPLRIRSSPSQRRTRLPWAE